MLAPVASLLRATCVVVISLTGMGLPAASAQDGSHSDCEALADAAGAAAGLPAGLLPAIARVESGHKGRAWPWTLNQGGAGAYFASKAETIAALEAILAQGVRNVDLGCMQLNWRWHSAAFPDAATMLDPVANTRYAAAFLRELFARTGDWDKAVALYHSSETDRGTRYRDKVMAMVAQLPDTATGAQAAALGTEIAQDQDQDISTATQVRGLLAVSAQPIVTRAAGRDLRAAVGRGLLHH